MRYRTSPWLTRTIAVAAGAGLAWMLLLMLSGPTVEIDHIEMTCRSVLEAPFDAEAGTVLAWCDRARIARTGYAALLAVPTTVLAVAACRPRRRPAHARRRPAHARA